MTPAPKSGNGASPSASRNSTTTVNASSSAYSSAPYHRIPGTGQRIMVALGALLCCRRWISQPLLVQTGQTSLPITKSPSCKVSLKRDMTASTLLQRLSTLRIICNGKCRLWVFLIFHCPNPGWTLESRLSKTYLDFQILRYAYGGWWEIVRRQNNHNRKSNKPKDHCSRRRRHFTKRQHWIANLQPNEAASGDYGGQGRWIDGNSCRLSVNAIL